jgi:hypothetical protein
MRATRPKQGEGCLARSRLRAPKAPPVTIIYGGIAPCSEPGRHGGTRNGRALPLLVARATT